MNNEKETTEPKMRYFYIIGHMKDTKAWKTSYVAETTGQAGDILRVAEKGFGGAVLFSAYGPLTLIELDAIRAEPKPWPDEFAVNFAAKLLADELERLAASTDKRKETLAEAKACS